MLILVAVTVSYSIKSGILSKAQEAAMKYEQNEIKDIVGVSIVYKITATTIKNTIYVDLPKTSVEIYKNLTANGFKIPENKTDESVEDENKNNLGIGVKIVENNTIDLTVIGKYGEYNGQIGSAGITKEIAKVEESVKINKDTNTPTFKLNNFINDYTLENGYIVIPLDKFMTACGLTDDIKENKYFLGIGDFGFLADSDANVDETTIHCYRASMLGMESEGDYAILLKFDDNDNPTNVIFEFFESEWEDDDECVGASVGIVEDKSIGGVRLIDNFFEKYGEIEFYLIDPAPIFEPMSQ